MISSLAWNDDCPEFFFWAIGASRLPGIHFMVKKTNCIDERQQFQWPWCTRSFSSNMAL
jgi:hypothetical protein